MQKNKFIINLLNLLVFIFFFVDSSFASDTWNWKIRDTSTDTTHWTKISEQDLQKILPQFEKNQQYRGLINQLQVESWQMCEAEHKEHGKFKISLNSDGSKLFFANDPWIEISEAKMLSFFDEMRCKNNRDTMCKYKEKILENFQRNQKRYCYINHPEHGNFKLIFDDNDRFHLFRKKSYDDDDKLWSESVSITSELWSKPTPELGRFWNKISIDEFLSKELSYYLNENKSNSSEKNYSEYSISQYHNDSGDKLLEVTYVARELINGDQYPLRDHFKFNMPLLKSEIEDSYSQMSMQIPSVINYMSFLLEGKISSMGSAASAGSDESFRHGAVINTVGGIARDTLEKHDHKSNFIGGSFGYEHESLNQLLGIAVSSLKYNAKYMDKASQYNIYIASIYNILNFDDGFFSFSAFYGKSFTKNINNNSLDNPVYGGNLMIGKKFAYGQNKLTPFVSGSYAGMKSDFLKEIGADQDLQNVGDGISRAVKVSFNFRYSYDFQMKSSIITPTLTVGFATDVLDSPDLKLQFNPGENTYDIKLPNRAKIISFIAPSLSIQNDILKLSASVRLEKGRNYFAGMGSLNLALKF